MSFVDREGNHLAPENRGMQTRLEDDLFQDPSS